VAKLQNKNETAKLFGQNFRPPLSFCPLNDVKEFASRKQRVREPQTHSPRLANSVFVTGKHSVAERPIFPENLVNFLFWAFVKIIQVFVFCVFT
jgi:hypothetical protein